MITKHGIMVPGKRMPKRKSKPRKNKDHKISNADIIEFTVNAPLPKIEETEVIEIPIVYSPVEEDSIYEVVEEDSKLSVETTTTDTPVAVKYEDKPLTILEMGLVVLSKLNTWLSAASVADKAVGASIWLDPPKSYQSSMSAALRKAATQGILESKREGRRVLYKITTEATEQVQSE